MNNDEQEMVGKLVHLTFLLRRLAHRDHRGPMAAPYQGQGRILALLALKPEMSQRELATILAIRSQSLGELLAKLEQKGYIVRTPAEDDKRAMNIRLTDEGREAAEAADQPDPDSLFAGISDEERDAFRTTLDRLVSALQERLGPEGPSDSRPGPGRPGHPRGRGWDRGPRDRVVFWDRW